MPGVEVKLAGESGDGHRRLPLAVDLDELRPEVVERPPGVLHVHRPAAVDDGLQMVEVRAPDPRRLEQPHDHRRGEEEARPRVGVEEVDDLLRMEPAALGDDLGRPSRDVGERVAAGGVRHRGGMDDAVPLADGVHVAEVVHGLRDEVPVGEGRALRPAGGAARVEEPGGGRRGRSPGAGAARPRAARSTPPRRPSGPGVRDSRPHRPVRPASRPGLRSRSRRARPSSRGCTRTRAGEASRSWGLHTRSRTSTRRARP